MVFSANLSLMLTLQLNTCTVWFYIILLTVLHLKMETSLVSVVKNKSIKRKSCFEEQTPFCGLLLVSILNSCLEYRLNEVSCAYLHFLYFCRKHLLNIRVLVSSTDRLVACRVRVRFFLKKGFKLL